MFEVEASLFMRAHGLPDRGQMHRIDISASMASRKRQTLEIIDSVQVNLMRAIVFFMRGGPGGLQCGISIDDVPELVTRVKPKLAEGVGRSQGIPFHVVLYCCATRDSVDGSCTGCDHGFAEAVRDEFCKAGVRWVEVYAHAVTGHPTLNPRAMRFRGDGSPVGATPGSWIVSPEDEGRRSLLWKSWTSALRGHGPWHNGMLVGCVGHRARDFRFHAPFMTTEQLHAELLTREMTEASV